MRRKNDIKFILNTLKDYYSMNNVQFASFLGIAPTTLSSWKERNSIDYELVYSKCVGINADWLLTGEGEMLKKEKPTIEVKSVDNEFLLRRFEELVRENEKLKEELGNLKKRNPKLYKEIHSVSMVAEPKLERE